MQAAAARQFAEDEAKRRADAEKAAELALKQAADAHAERLRLQENIDEARRQAELLAAQHSGDLDKEREARLKAEEAMKAALKQAEDAANLAQQKAAEAAVAAKRAEVCILVV